MTALESEVRLEGFAETLKGHRIYCVGTPATLPALVRSRVAVLDTEVAHRGRKVLFLYDGAHFGPWLQRLKWDAVFHVHDAQDLRLGLTYVANAQRPIRLVWAGGEPANTVFAALTRVEGLTVLGFGAQQPMAGDWDAIFWTHETAPDMIEATLQPRMGHVSTVRSVLREITAADVGLVWSAIGETSRRGALYWFDPAEGGGAAATYSATEAAELLRSIADSFCPPHGSGSAGHPLR
jgi:hypothetical protein